MAIKTVAVLTGGGDCPGLNAVIQAVTKTLLHLGVKVWGIQNGFGGLVHKEIVPLTLTEVSGILPRGGTVLGTTNRDNPFHFPIQENGKIVYKDMSTTVMENLKQYGIEALIVIGGDGSLHIASGLSDMGFPIVAVPKTIDNDIPMTERTFGFDTAVSIATDALDRLHTTAESHHRIMVLEVMGRYAGWIALYAGLAGGADCILMPEIPYNIESILAKIRERQQNGKLFSNIVIAEGAKPVDGDISIAFMVEGSHDQIRLGGAGNKLAVELERLSGLESRCTVLGHLQRGGSPSSFDRVLATRYGVAAAKCVMKEQFGVMVALKCNSIVQFPIKDVVDGNGNVPITGELVNVGRSIGICFG